MILEKRFKKYISERNSKKSSYPQKAPTTNPAKTTTVSKKENNGIKCYAYTLEKNTKN